MEFYNLQPSIKSSQELSYIQQSQQIAEIIQDQKMAEREELDALLAAGSEHVQNYEELESVYNKYKKLAKKAPEYAKISGDTNLGLTRNDKIEDKIESLLANGINSMGEIGRLMGLLSLLGASAGPGLLAQAKGAIKDFFTGQAATQDPQQIMNLMGHLEQLGPLSGPLSQLLGDVKEMLSEFLSQHDFYVQEALLGIGQIALDKIEDNIEALIDDGISNSF